MSARRFTLIDLGAVITLSAIGLGVVVQPAIPPACQDDFKQGCESGRTLPDLRALGLRKQCASRLKTLGIAQALYEGDGMGVRPGPDPWKKHGLGPGWDEMLAIQMGAHIYDPARGKVSDKPYAKHHAAAKTLENFSCPDDPATATSATLIRSYGLNLGSAEAATGIQPTDANIPISKIASANDTACIVEYSIGSSFGVRQGNYSIGFAGGTARDNELIQWLATAKLHRLQPAQVNVLFYDGHVEALEASALAANDRRILKYLNK